MTMDQVDNTMTATTATGAASDTGVAESPKKLKSAQQPPLADASSVEEQVVGNGKSLLSQSQQQKTGNVAADVAANAVKRSSAEKDEPSDDTILVPSKKTKLNTNLDSTQADNEEEEKKKKKKTDDNGADSVKESAEIKTDSAILVPPPPPTATTTNTTINTPLKRKVG